MSNVIPEKVINYNVYDDTEKLVAVAGETTLPSFEALTETISGAGILGEYESPTIGHFGSQTLEINFRVLMDPTFRLSENKSRTIVLRAAQQSYDVAEGRHNVRPLKIIIKGLPKGVELGKLAPGGMTDSKNTIEVLYIKIEENGKSLLEFDKLNFVYIVNGKDELADLRSAL